MKIGERRRRRSHPGARRPVHLAPRFYSLGADARVQLQLAERRLFEQALVLVDAVEITSTELLD
jgi:hypothetical protein